MGEPRSLRVLKAGLQTTVQDLGRSGLGRYGVAPNGALDRAALILGNRLLDNERDAAALECSLIGPAIELTAGAIVAITGAGLGAQLNDSPMPLWQPMAVRAGDVIDFDPGAAAAGARAYLCVAGGIDVGVVLGSRGTDLIGRFGGWQGRALKAGDELPIGPLRALSADILRRRLAAPPPEISPQITARVVLGPQRDRFTEQGMDAFLGDAYRVTAKSNRQGIRLAGAIIQHARGADMLSEGIAHGAVQVPGEGQPIMLLAGRQTVGGYTKIATVAGADLDAFGQLRPGDSVRFNEVTVTEARAALIEYQRRFGPGAVRTDTALFAGASLNAESLHGEVLSVAGNWDADGMIRVIEALDRSGAESFSIDAGGLKLDRRRQPTPSSRLHKELPFS